MQPVVRIRTNRYGELDEHELVRLLDTIEDERARSRFRESIYISLFFWLAVAWLIFYGPRVLWHAPQLISPADAIKQHELTQLNMPVLRQPAPKPAPKPVRQLDNQTLKQLQKMAREEAAAPPPPTPTPAPATTTPPPSAPVSPSPAHTTSSTPIPEAPAPQHQTQPNFNTGSNLPGDNIRKALNGSRPGSGGDFRPSPESPLGAGADILSDTQGVDFGPYIRRILSDIRRNWEPLLPEEIQPPISKQGETYIRFKILPDGNIQAMFLDGSTKDVAIDKSCWNAITSEGQFPPLPSQFHGPNLELRIHFLVNKDIGR